MFRKLLLISYCLILISNFAVAQDSTQIYWEEFYPLHIGDFWKYVIETPGMGLIEIETKEVIAETTMSNNLTYKKLLRINHSLKERWYYYERVDSVGNVYGYLSGLQREVLLWGLGISIGETWRDWFDLSVVGDSVDYWQLKGKLLLPFFGGDSVIYLSFRLYNHLGGVLWDSSDVGIAQNFGVAFSVGGCCGEAYEKLVGAVIKGKVYGDTLAVVQEEKLYPLIPKRFILYQNYPNPFNSSTHFRYELSKGGEATLKIFNLKGEVVKMLVDQNQKPGTYRLVWNGCDEAGKEVSSGIYLYQLRVDSETQTKKLTVIK